MSAPQLVENFFRHEYGKLVSVLSCRFGIEHLEDVEDAVQSSLSTALEHWPRHGVPENPSGWLYRVAFNSIAGELRQRNGRRRLLDERMDALVPTADAAIDESSAEEQEGDLLRMLFVACDDVIPVESQIVFALNTLSGFNVREIAHRLFTSETNVYKRLTRAKSRLRESKFEVRDLSVDRCQERLPAVRRILYVMFTEGHLCSDGDLAIRQELCAEALRLAAILVNHPVGKQPESYALLALMYLQSARLSGRRDGDGELLLLEDQDRSLWDRSLIRQGLEWLARAASGDAFSRYHAEAGIAAEHCLAASFATTRWDRVVACYELLEQAALSPLHRLNRAVAVAEWKGPNAGLSVLNGFNPPTWLTGSYQWAAVMADLHRRCDHDDEATRYREVALAVAPTEAIRRALARRLGAAN